MSFTDSDVFSTLIVPSNGRIKIVDRRIKQHRRKQTTIVAAKQQQKQQFDCPSFTFKRINNFKAAHIGAFKKIGILVTTTCALVWLASI